MSEINPSKGIRSIIIEKVDEFESLDDANDFFRGIRSWMKGMLQQIEKIIKNFKNSKIRIDSLIEEIENMESLNKEKIKQAVIEMIKNMEEGK